MSTPDWRQACEHLDHELYLELTGNKEATAMDINQAFPSKWLKASDLQGKTLKVTINHVERIDGEDAGELKGKIAMYFERKEKGMILNKTNGMNLAAVFGNETNNWKGREIILFVETVQFQGKPTEALRVRPHQEVEMDDSIPF